MKGLLSILVLGLTLLTCDREDCCVLTPELAEFHGEWKLERVTNGFAQLELIGSDEIGYQENLYINAANKTFIVQIDNLPKEMSRLEKGKQGDLDALILLDEGMYHWYSFELWKNKEYLVLYQKCPIDAFLADGSYYYYSKQ